MGRQRVDLAKVVDKILKVSILKVSGLFDLMNQINLTPLKSTPLKS
jgi:hypothetical protein